MNKDVKTLRPFTRFLMTIGQLPSSYLVSMTYEEQLLWFCNFLEKEVIPTVNNNAEAVIELQEYVKNYFDNLDVQEEINNKLDDMADSGELAEIIGDYLETKCEFIYPGQWGNNTAGNSSIIKYKDKILLFDTNRIEAYDYLKNMLFENSITHIDYVIISHFDWDHSTNFINLVNDGYINSNTIYYHPDCPAQIYSTDAQQRYSDIEDICTSNNITSIIPTEKQTVNILEDLTLKFGNCDTYYTINNYDNPNSASMIVEVNHDNFKSLFMGDAQSDTLKRLYDENFITSEIKLYNIPHHGVNSNLSFTQFYDIINPEISITQVQLKDFTENKMVLNQETALLKDKGCVNYFSFNNEENLHFIEQFGVITCTKGVPFENVGHNAVLHTIYVDPRIDLESKQDGTIDHPFRDLPQAVGSIADFKNSPVQILLAPGNYGTLDNLAQKNRTNIQSFKNILEITTTEEEGERIINYGILIQNSFKVRISNVTILTSDNRDYGVYTANANIWLHNCIIKSDNTTKREYGIRSLNYSEITLTDCTFSYLVSAIYGRSNSKFNVENCNFDNITQIYNTDNSCNVIQHSLGTYDLSTITNINNYSSSNATEFKNIEPYILNIPSSSPIMTGDITLPFTTNNVYKYMEIRYDLRYNSSNSGRCKEIVSLEDLSSYRLSKFYITSGGNLRFYTATLNISYTNKNINISNNVCGNYTSNGIDVYNPSTASDNSYGIQILNIKFF